MFQQETEKGKSQGTDSPILQVFTGLAHSHNQSSGDPDPGSTSLHFCPLHSPLIDTSTVPSCIILLLPALKTNSRLLLPCGFDIRASPVAPLRRRGGVSIAGASYWFCAFLRMVGGCGRFGLLKKALARYCVGLQGWGKELESNFVIRDS